MVSDSRAVRLAVHGRASNRCLMTCSPLEWMRVVIFISRYGYEPNDTDISGITAECAEEFSLALEQALLFTPELAYATQVTAWREMQEVPADTRLTHKQLALRECLF